MTPDRSEDRQVVLADDGQCQAEYSAAGNAIQIRVGAAGLRLTPAEFLALCATLLKAARALGRQEYIPGLAAQAVAPGAAAGACRVTGPGRARIAASRS